MRLTVCGGLAILLFAGSVGVQAQDILREQTRIPRGAKVFVHSMDGFENYLLAAFTKKKTPVVVVETLDQADFEIEGKYERQDRHWAEELFKDRKDVDRAAIRVKHRASGTLAFTYVVEKEDPWAPGKSAAEACAKHLKNYIEKGR